jgi:hypothetical protein
MRRAKPNWTAACARIVAGRIGCTAILLAMACDLAAAQRVPMPRPRPVQGTAAPAQAAPNPQQPAPPSACRLRLTAELAIAPSLPSIIGPGECGADDVVRLEAVLLTDKTRVALAPPAVLRCQLAEVVVHWVRDDVAPATRSLAAALKSIESSPSYECRVRNHVVGAKLSEHGKANALDLHALRLANSTVLKLTDPHVAKDFRDALRKSACARFKTVLGPGSDGHHENHVHVDLRERRGGYRMCQWDVREPGEEPAAGVSNVPLPRRRPTTTTKAAL